MGCRKATERLMSILLQTCQRVRRSGRGPGRAGSKLRTAPRPPEGGGGARARLP